MQNQKSEIRNALIKRQDIDDAFLGQIDEAIREFKSRYQGAQGKTDFTPKEETARV
mgnify:CR=1 FL=1